MIRWFNEITGNYLIALLLFAIVVKLVMAPLAVKQQKNQIKQAKLRPLEMAIRRRYSGRNDKVTQQKVQQEVMELYQQEGYSPFSGCLPLLIQFPIIISLYQIIRKPLTYICSISAEGVNAIIGKLQSFGMFADKTVETLAEDQISLVNAVKGLTDVQFAEIAMIENVDKIADINLTVFGVLDLAQTPSFGNISWLWLIPVITFVTSFLGMKISRKFQPQPATQQSEDAAASMKMMDITMPLMSVFFTFMFSGAIGVYWIYQNVLNVIQTIIIAKIMPIPPCSEEDIRAAEKQLAGKGGKNKKRELDPNRPKPRSLHHIDDDDEDVPPSPAEADKEEEEEAGKEAPASPDAPKLKDDEQGKYRNK